MGARQRNAGTTRPRIALAVFAALLLMTGAGFSMIDAGASRPAATAEPLASRATPDLMHSARSGDVDIWRAWYAQPEDPELRAASACVYDNGAPIDDFGDPAAQLSEAPAPEVYQFVAAVADDFELIDYVSPDANCRITLVRAAFSFFNSGAEGVESLITWLSDPANGPNNGVVVTVYAHDGSLEQPDDVPDEAVDPALWGLVSQFVPAANLVNEVQIGTCKPCFQVDIPVDFVLQKNTRYWLSLMLRFPAMPQSAWCISELADQGLFVAHRGFEEVGIPFWNEIVGNHGCPSAPLCPPQCDEATNPTGGTNREMAFTLFGQEVPPNIGACCDEFTGVCTDGDLTDPQFSCDGPFEVFHPRTLCEFISCQPVVGACCDDSTGGCTSESIADCQGPGQRFAAGLDCTVPFDPPCGTTALGACCFQGQPCAQDMTPAECAAAGGNWFATNDCAAIDCPPDNDDCLDAIVISGDGVFNFDTTGATTDGLLSEPGCTDVKQDVWFKYLPACTGTLTLSLCDGTGYDAAISVYDGCGCGANLGAQIECDDDACGVDGASSVTFPATLGDCYLVRIGGDGVATGPGSLAASCVPPGEGACCLSAGGCLITDEPNCTALGGEFSFVGNPCLPQTCPPPNDDCANAILIGDGIHPFDTRGATIDGPLVEPPCTTDANQDIWFDYQAVCDGDLTVSTCFGTLFDGTLAVYDGWACAPLGSQIDCDDDGCGAPGSPGELMIPVAAGAQFKIRIGGAGSATGVGQILIGCVPPGLGACCMPDAPCTEMTPANCTAQGGVPHVGLPCSPLTCPPPNDDCVNAVLIEDGVHPIDTRGATTDGPSDSPGGFCTQVNQDIWFEYTASCVGVLRASLCLDADYDSALAVYEGCGVCPPTLLVECDNDACEVGGASEVEVLDVTPGTCYLIRVGGSGTAFGTGTLSIGCLPPNAGACCHEDTTCEILLPSLCNAPGDVFWLDEPCSPITCPSLSCCVGDANPDGALDGKDIDAFMQSLLAPVPPDNGTYAFCWADVNEDDVIDLADIPPFVQKILAGEACTPEPTGACCLPDESCVETTVAQCAFQSGAYWGDDVPCTPSPCVPVSGACCFSDGTCQELDTDACATAQGAFQGGGSTCTPNPCPLPAAGCCFNDGSCQVLPSDSCEASNGIYQGIGSTCDVDQLVSEAVVVGPIPDCSHQSDDPRVDTQTISDCGLIADLDVELVITHAWVGDLFVTLTHEDSGTTVVLMSRVGFDEQPGPRCSDNVCCGNGSDDVDVVFDDGAVDSVEDGPFPLAGTYHPDPGSSGLPGTLAAFNGLDRCGDWTLRCYDGYFPDAGTLVRWSLNFTTNPCEPQPGCSTCLGDTSADGAVDALDIQPFADCLLGTGVDCTCADFSGDGAVDLTTDLPAFTDALLQAVGPCP